MKRFREYTRVEAVGPFQRVLSSISSIDTFAAVAVPLDAADGAIMAAVATGTQRILVELRAREMRH